MPQKPEEIFTAAAPFYEFSSAALKPWHMKVSYQLYDEKSKPTAAGTFDYWFASPDVYRSTWKRPRMDQTAWQNGSQHLHLGEGEPVSYFGAKLKSYLLAPLPDQKSLDSEEVRLETRDEVIGGVKLPCVMLVRKMSSNAKDQTEPMGMFPHLLL